MSDESSLKDDELGERVFAALDKLSGWPLDAHGTYAALVLMGLTSRLQPVHVSDSKARVRVMQLAQEIAADAVAADEARHARDR